MKVLISSYFVRFRTYNRLHFKSPTHIIYFEGNSSKITYNYFERVNTSKAEKPAYGPVSYLPYNLDYYKKLLNWEVWRCKKEVKLLSHHC